MTYDEWEATVPAELKGDASWRVQAFRLACFLSACAELDTETAVSDPRHREHAGQLCRAATSISATLGEGYARISPRDRVRYYEYALGSATEAKTWYLALRGHLGPEALAARFALLHSITRLILTMIRSERAKSR